MGSAGGKRRADAVQTVRPADATHRRSNAGQGELLMKMTTSTASRQLREANPVSDVAFADAARDAYGQATLEAIFDASAASPKPWASDAVPERAGAAPGATGARAGRERARSAAARPRWRVVLPATALT